MVAGMSRAWSLWLVLTQGIAMKLDRLLSEARACTICQADFPLGPKPLVQGSALASVLIIGQAPGRRTHEQGIPWDDASGRRLRAWLGVDDATFYDEKLFALMPMGFCYPGTGTGGDLPPDPRCAARWHEPLLDGFGSVKLTILIGAYAIRQYEPALAGSVTLAVKAYSSLLPNRLVLPHPSPRNNRWLKQNPWFEADVLPRLRSRVHTVVST